MDTTAVASVSGAGAGAGTATAAHHSAPHPIGRRYEIVSSNFRLASKKIDGYDAWASQVGDLVPTTGLPQLPCLIAITLWLLVSLPPFPSLRQSDKKILHGSVAIITVEDGEVAVVRNVGKRQTLGPGRYRLEVPQQVGAGPLQWAWSESACE
jgi:hypothetical protein